MKHARVGFSAAAMVAHAVMTGCGARKGSGLRPTWIDDGVCGACGAPGKEWSCRGLKSFAAGLSKILGRPTGERTQRRFRASPSIDGYHQQGGLQRALGGGGHGRRPANPVSKVLV